MGTLHYLRPENRNWGIFVASTDPDLQVKLELETNGFTHDERNPRRVDALMDVPLLQLVSEIAEAQNLNLKEMQEAVELCLVGIHEANQNQHQANGYEVQ